MLLGLFLVFFVAVGDNYSSIKIDFLEANESLSIKI